MFTGAGQLRIERHDASSWNLLGETTGDGVADFMIRLSGVSGDPTGLDFILR
jgi:hypothetical protein